MLVGDLPQVAYPDHLILAKSAPFHQHVNPIDPLGLLTPLCPLVCLVAIRHPRRFVGCIGHHNLPLIDTVPSSLEASFCTTFVSFSLVLSSSVAPPSFTLFSLGAFTSGCCMASSSFLCTTSVPDCILSDMLPLCVCRLGLQRELTGLSFPFFTGRCFFSFTPPAVDLPSLPLAFPKL